MIRGLDDWVTPCRSISQSTILPSPTLPDPRSDARPKSYWDVLIVLDGPVDDDREEALCRRLFDLELEGKPSAR